MATKIVIPEVGESITSGVIAAWSVADGEYVERDQTVLELETDKITMEVPAPAAGVIKHGAAEGDEVEVGSSVGEIDESAEKPGGGSGEKKAESSASSHEQQPEKQAETKSSTGKGEKRQASDGAGETGGSTTATQEKAAETERVPQARVDRGQPGQATPLAEKVAGAHGVDLGSIKGTGAGGRIREQDVLAYLQSAPQGNGATSNGSSNGSATARGVHRDKMTPLRQRVANRLVEAQHTAAMLTTFNEVDMTAVMDLRKQYKEDFEKKHGVGLGFMSFFVKAVVQGLKAFPLVNGFIAEDDSGKPVIQTHDYCDVAIAVASPKGLVVPVLRNAEQLSFAQIESGIKELAVKARDGKLTIDEMTGGTFTITNGGVFGSLMSTPILNPPQSAILGMHTIKKRAVEDPNNPGSIALRPMMYLAVSYDHRIIDGAEAVQFLVTIKNCIENPERILMDV
ncbi:MAG: 2-oxoglutarate dehydrogenase complex dihydrolipoyllysine-residue succinyltransferase [Phycisphaerales bacterium]|jgi:2-oxoglutarate dehydrogenase E2 component (dihydrolipoamide succinyltransferase)